jgi:hypothetical protein
MVGRRGWVSPAFLIIAMAQDLNVDKGRTSGAGKCCEDDR